jgi:hypothetical protein
MQQTAARLLNVLANNLTPSTLAAVVNDLGMNDGITDRDQSLIDWVRSNLRRQIICMVGEDEAADLLDNGQACPGCGECHHDKLVWDADGEVITCATCGCEYVPAGARA